MILNIIITSAGLNSQISKNLKIMDWTAVQLAKESSQILKVVNMSKTWAIINAIEGKKEGSTIS